MIDKFPIDTQREFVFAFATLKDDQAFRIWLRSAHLGSNPRVMDAAELATLAFRRWREALVKKRVANDSADLIDRIRDNPHVEVTVLVLIRAPWLRTNKLVGMCHLRRTWCNNVYIDFLTVHPRALAGRNRPEGIGTALLYFVTCIAKEINAASIWGEATQNSATFYQKVFSKPGIKDLIFLKKKDYTSFSDRITSDLLSVPSKVSD